MSSASPCVCTFLVQNCIEFSLPGYTKSQLKGEMLEPTWAPDLVKYRLSGMYTTCTYSATKEAIVKTICDASSPLCVVVATIAFGMGLDCPTSKSCSLGSTR